MVLQEDNGTKQKQSNNPNGKPHILGISSLFLSLALTLLEI